jgi:hypothetical protein
LFDDNDVERQARSQHDTITSEVKHSECCKSLHCNFRSYYKIAAVSESKPMSYDPSDGVSQNFKSPSPCVDDVNIVRPHNVSVVIIITVTITTTITSVIILIPIEHSHTRMRGAMSNKLGPCPPQRTQTRRMSSWTSFHEAPIASSSGDEVQTGGRSTSWSLSSIRATAAWYRRWSKVTTSRIGGSVSDLTGAAAGALTAAKAGAATAAAAGPDEGDFGVRLRDGRLPLALVMTGAVVLGMTIWFARAAGLNLP